MSIFCYYRLVIELYYYFHERVLWQDHSKESFLLFDLATKQQGDRGLIIEQNMVIALSFSSINPFHVLPLNTRDDGSSLSAQKMLARSPKHYRRGMRDFIFSSKKFRLGYFFLFLCSENVSTAQRIWIFLSHFWRWGGVSSMQN